MIGVLDTETGGFSKEKNGVCEIAMTALNHHLEIVDKFHCYIRPYARADDSDELVSYKDDAMAINGLNVELLIEKGLAVDYAMHMLHEFITRNGIVKIMAHNAPFDIPRVQHLINRFLPKGDAGTVLLSLEAMEKIDTLKEARKRWPQRTSHKLEHLCEWLGIENKDKHTAKGDCYSTIELYKHLIS